MLGRDQLRTWVDRLGAPASQVERDHLISHILVPLRHLVPEATFFGGTAPCRTHLLDWRLSEDIDLLVDDPADTRDRLSEHLAGSLRREYPELTLEWGTVDEEQVAQVRAGAIGVRVQMVKRDASYRRYPVAPTAVALRYADLPEQVEMLCPTRDAAAAMKLAPWPVQPQDFAEVRLPNDRAWRSALDHQMRPVPDRQQALSMVRMTVASLAGWTVAGC